MDCSRHMTFSIMGQISKIILKKVNERLKKKMEETVNNVHFGFRKGLRQGMRHSCYGR